MAEWQTVSPAKFAEMKGLLKWFRTGSAHPHKECTRALVKKGVPESRAVKICAVAKDMAFKSTKWRNSGSKK